MGAISGIMAVRVNSLTGSVVIVYGKDIALDKLPYLLLEACKRAIKNLRFTGSLTKTDAALVDFATYFDSLWKRTQKSDINSAFSPVFAYHRLLRIRFSTAC